MYSSLATHLLSYRGEFFLVWFKLKVKRRTREVSKVFHGYHPYDHKVYFHLDSFFIITTVLKTNRTWNLTSTQPAGQILLKLSLLLRDRFTVQRMRVNENTVFLPGHAVSSMKAI